MPSDASTQHVLYGSGTSPFVRKVRAAALLKRVPMRFELLSSWHPASGIEALNPLAKVLVWRRRADGSLLLATQPWWQDTAPALPPGARFPAP